MPWVRWLEEIDHEDARLVGEKNAALGEAVRHLSSAGVRVPEGVALIADAYRAFLRHNELLRPIEQALAGVPGQTVDRLAETSALLRRLVLAGTFPDDVAREVLSAYRSLSRVACDPIDATERAWVAVRSSVVTRSPSGDAALDHRFAGLHDSYLYVQGEERLLDRVRRCWASLFHSFALSQRASLGLGPEDVAMSVGIQRMVQADEGCAGEASTVDPASGDPEVVLVTSSWGLGEGLAQGRVGPDAYYLHKEAVRRRRGSSPVVVRKVGAKELQVLWDDGAGELVVRAPSASRRAALTLDDDDVIALARLAVNIEDHWSLLHGRRTPVDVTWARDGGTGQLFVLQVRPARAARLEREPAEEASPALDIEFDVGGTWSARGALRDPGPVVVLQRLARSDALGVERNRLEEPEVSGDALTRLVQEAVSELGEASRPATPEELPPSTL